MNKIFGEAQNIIQELYLPSFSPEQSKLAKLIPMDKTDTEIIDNRVKEAEQQIFQSKDENAKPLTAEEAVAIQKKVLQMRDAIAATRYNITRMRKIIDDKINEDGELAFSVDLRKKQRLRRAIKKTFNITPTELTYEMYILALETKRQIEKEEANNYANGTWEEKD